MLWFFFWQFIAVVFLNNHRWTINPFKPNIFISNISYMFRLNMIIIRLTTINKTQIFVFSFLWPAWRRPVRSKNVADIWTKYFVVFSLVLRCTPNKFMYMYVLHIMHLVCETVTVREVILIADDIYSRCQSLFNSQQASMLSSALPPTSFSVRLTKLSQITRHFVTML